MVLQEVVMVNVALALIKDSEPQYYSSLCNDSEIKEKR